MRCTELYSLPALTCALTCALALTACGSPSPTPAAPSSASEASAAAAAAAAAGASAAQAQPGVSPLPSVAPAPAAAASTAPRPKQPRYVQLPPPATPRSMDELQRQFAKRLVEAHPDATFTRTAPPRLLAIPVIEVELNADGSVRGTRVVRHPSTGPEATTLALAAIRRAAPYGNVSRLPKPWKIVETFLFDDDLRFKPRTLDLD